MRVLIVDDAPFVREILKNICEQCGYICVGETGDGDEAVTMTQQLSPDLIILDLILPQKNGLDVIKAIRDKNLESMILVTSTLPKAEMEKKCRDAGSIGYIEKPFKKQEVVYFLNALYKIERKLAHG